MLTTTTGPARASTSYISSVDLMRGLVMVLMALDHVRWFFTDTEFYPTDLSHTDSATIDQPRAQITPSSSSL